MSKESTTKNFLLRRGAPSLSLLCVAHWSRAHCFARVVMMMIIWPIRETFSCLVIYSERNSVSETFPIRRTHAAIRNCAVKHTEKRKSHENPSNRQDTSATSGEKNLQFFMVDRCERKTLWVESLFFVKLLMFLPKTICENWQIFTIEDICARLLSEEPDDQRVYAHACETSLRK